MDTPSVNEDVVSDSPQVLNGDGNSPDLRNTDVAKPDVTTDLLADTRDAAKSDATADAATAPTSPLGGGKAIGVAAGGQFTCALFEKGTVECWGGGGEVGTLGNGTSQSTLWPVSVANITSAKSISAGSRTCLCPP